MRRQAILALSLLAMIMPLAVAHIDTETQVKQPDPLVKTFEAEATPTVGAARIVDEERARGGKALALGVGGGLKLDFGTLPVGVHGLWVCARVRVDEENAIVPGPDAGKGKRQDRKPLYLEFRVNDQPGGAESLHRLRVTYSAESNYEYLVNFYFHTPEERAYRGTLTVGPRTLIRNTYLDFVDLRNPLAKCPLTAVKTRRTIFDDDTVKLLRDAAVKEGRLLGPYRTHPLTETERLARDDVIWKNFPRMNAQLGGTYYGERIGSAGKEFKQAVAFMEKKLGRELGLWTPIAGNDFDTPWGYKNKTLGLTYTIDDYRAGKAFPKPWPFPEDGGGYFYDKDTYGTEVSFNHGRIGTYNQEGRLRAVQSALGTRGTFHNSWVLDLPNRYLLTGDMAAAEDAAFLLVALAYNYPGYEWSHAVLNTYRYPGVSTIGQLAFWTRNGGNYQGLCEAYDKLFPYIQDNKRLAMRIGRFVPWVKTPEDVIALVDTFLVQRGIQDTIQRVGRSQGLVKGVLTLGPGKVSEAALDVYFTRIYLRNSLNGFPDSMIGSFSRDGLNFIGSTFYTMGESVTELYEPAKNLRRFVELGGAKRFDVSDPARYPRLSAMAESIIDLHLAGGFRLGIGDVGTPDAPPRPHLAGQGFWLDAFRWSKDPRVARLLVDRFGRGDATDKEWAAVEKAAEGMPDPILHSRSHVLEGFGAATLEEGSDSDDPRRKNAVMLRFGVGSGHAHPDTLDLEVYAHGLKMSGDMGGRVMAKYGRPSCMSQLVHNLVAVDGGDMNGGPKNSTGTGWLEAFVPTPGAQFVQASGYGETHPQVSLYNRGVLQVMCDAGDANREPSGYVFDVFRVAGGQRHRWAFHGAVPEDFTCNAGLKPLAGDDVPEFLRRHRAGTQRGGVAPEALSATWKLRRTPETVGKMQLPNSEKSMLGKLYDPASPPKFTRVTLFGHEGDKVLAANWYADKMKAYHRDVPVLYAVSEGKALQSVYPALIEPYAGEAPIVSASRVPLGGTDAKRAVALQVSTRFGQDDFMYSSLDGGKPYGVAKGITASGRLSFISRDKDGLRLLNLVGGSELAMGGVRVTVERPAYEGTIERVDYARRRVFLNEPLPKGVLGGEILTVGNDVHRTSCRVSGVDGKRLDMVRTASAYRGGVERLTDAGGAVLDVAPYLYDYHPNYYNGMTVTSESGKVIGRAKVTLGDRYFFTGWPASRNHLNKIDPADITDANGDGRRTVTMVCDVPVRKRAEDGSLVTLKPGDVMMDMEVTRVREDGFMIWTKQYDRVFVDALGVPHPGWPYHQQIVRNERGDKQWIVNMPGDTYELAIDGRALADTDLDDPDGDGRALVMLYQYGPGDTVTVPTHVCLRRTQPGVFELRANAACTVSLPGGAISVSVDKGASWRPLKAVEGGARIDADLLASGPVLLRVQ